MIMVKKSYKYTKGINLGVILVIFLIIIGVLYFSYNKFNKKDTLLNNSHAPSVIMPAVNYSYIDISIVDAKKLIEKNLNNSDFLIMDVSLNYNEGHIVDAINYPIQDGSLDNVINMLDKNKIYLIYGRNEIDSLNAAKKLAASHFEVYRLKGNYGAWVDQGYGTENSY